MAAKRTDDINTRRDGPRTAAFDVFDVLLDEPEALDVFVWFEVDVDDPNRG